MGNLTKEMKYSFQYNLQRRFYPLKRLKNYISMKVYRDGCPSGNKRTSKGIKFEKKSDSRINIPLKVLQISPQQLN